MIDKTTAIIEFLRECPTIKANPVFFNFGEIEDGTYQANIQSDEVLLNLHFIDGSVLKRYTLFLDSFKSVSYIPVVNGKSDENLEGFSEVQEVIDWINDKSNKQEFPDFGDDFVIEDMKTLTDRPALVGVNTQQNPPMAVYRISIQIDYVDLTKRIWC